jgi:poly(3-hydroxybutyrate) depolymerase
MDLYVPDGVGASPAVVVSLHYCGGNAGNAHGWFQSYADTNKFLIIAPKSAGSCFDAGLGRSGERANIVKMVDYVAMNNNADRKKVFAAGPSSGACMTQALARFLSRRVRRRFVAGGCSGGSVDRRRRVRLVGAASTTAQQWGDKVRNADPGFTGGRPRIQFWQGMGDTNLTYSQTYPAQLAQWTNVFGVTDANATKENIKPPGAVEHLGADVYKDCNGLVVVEANSGPSNVVHDLTPEGLWRDVVRFFGLTQGGTAVGSCRARRRGRRHGGATGSADEVEPVGRRAERRHGRREAGRRRKGGAGGRGGSASVDRRATTTAARGIAGTSGTGGVQGTGGSGGGHAGGAGGSGIGGSVGGGGDAGTTGSAGGGGSNAVAAAAAPRQRRFGRRRGNRYRWHATTGLGGMVGPGTGGSQMEAGGGGCACVRVRARPDILASRWRRCSSA